MIRTQISLDPTEYSLAQKQAQAMGISVAEFVRRAIRDHLALPSHAPWMKYAGFVESRDPRSSESIDEIVSDAKN
jgi:hypothetical protein